VPRPPAVLFAGGAGRLRDYDHLSVSGAALVADTLYASRLLVDGDARDVLREALGIGRGRGGRPCRAARPVGGGAQGGADALGAMGARARASGESLFAALDDGSEAVRHAAAQALARVGRRRTTGAARRVAAERRSLRRGVCRLEPRQLGAEAQDAVPELVRALGRDETNAVVAGALARIGPAAASAVPELGDGARERERGPSVAGGPDSRAGRAAGRRRRCRPSRGPSATRTRRCGSTRRGRWVGSGPRRDRQRPRSSGPPGPDEQVRRRRGRPWSGCTDGALRNGRKAGGPADPSGPGETEPPRDDGPADPSGPGETEPLGMTGSR